MSVIPPSQFNLPILALYEGLRFPHPSLALRVRRENQRHREVTHPHYLKGRPMEAYVKEQIKRLKGVVPKAQHEGISEVANGIFYTIAKLVSGEWNVLQGVALGPHVGLFFAPSSERVGRKQVKITKYTGETSGKLVLVANMFGWGENVTPGDIVTREWIEYRNGFQKIVGESFGLNGHAAFLCPSQALAGLLVAAKLDGKKIPNPTALWPASKVENSPTTNGDSDLEPLATAASEPDKLKDAISNAISKLNW